MHSGRAFLKQFALHVVVFTTTTVSVSWQDRWALVRQWGEGASSVPGKPYPGEMRLVSQNSQ